MCHEDGWLVVAMALGCNAIRVKTCAVLIVFAWNVRLVSRRSDTLKASL